MKKYFFVMMLASFFIPFAAQAAVCAELYSGPYGSVYWSLVYDPISGGALSGTNELEEWYGQLASPNDVRYDQWVITTDSSGRNCGCAGNLNSGCSASATNSCGQTSTNYGTFLCSGACSASTPSAPANPSGYGSYCTSAANACGQVNGGSIQCNGSCSASTPANPGGYGSYCTSSANACGQVNGGSIQCNGSCSASTPANPAGYGSTCYSAYNACGSRNSGSIQCNGSCSAGGAPANPAGYGSTCYSAYNACGSRNSGSIQCNGSCSASTPANPAGYGSACYSAYNACGSRNSGSIQCNGSCSAGSAPANPPGYGSVCTSAPNACGQTQSNGTIQCNGSCSSTSPPNSNCTPDLTAATPTISPASGMSVGQSLSLSSIISNIAFGPASSSFPNIFRINTSVLVSGSNIPSLAAGTSANTTASFTPTSAGTYTVSACTDNNTSWQGVITESNENNNCSGNATFTATACTASMTPSSVTIEQGQSATFSWLPSSSYCGFTSCTFADGASYTGASGTRSVSPSTTSTYGLSCVGPYNPAPGTASTYSTVTVLVPTATITANGQSTGARINPTTSNNTAIVWSSTNSTSCTVTKNGVPWKTGLSSAGVSDTVTAQTVYKIECQNHYIQVTASVMVNILPGFSEF